ncbi:Hypothetical protein D9617_6g094670 [Elsinoe fawcettii]|nr:Hypothetical protein D9617_6g094670 [Elsinoe fawcettii]
MPIFTTLFTSSPTNPASSLHPLDMTRTTLRHEIQYIRAALYRAIYFRLHCIPRRAQRDEAPCVHLGDGVYWKGWGKPGRGAGEMFDTVLGSPKVEPWMPVMRRCRPREALPRKMVGWLAPVDDIISDDDVSVLELDTGSCGREEGMTTTPAEEEGEFMTLYAGSTPSFGLSPTTPDEDGSYMTLHAGSTPGTQGTPATPEDDIPFLDIGEPLMRVEAKGEEHQAEGKIWWAY